jgi:hypothetical protein
LRDAVTNFSKEKNLANLYLSAGVVASIKASLNRALEFIGLGSMPTG